MQLLKRAPPEGPTHGAPAPGAVPDPTPVTVDPEAATADANTERSPLAMRIIAGLAVVATLWWAQAVLIPVVVSVLLSYILQPVVSRLEAIRLPRAMAVPLVIAALAATAAAGAYGLGGQATHF